MKKLYRYMERMPKIIISAISLLLVILLGIVDHLTGYEISFSIFYLVPLLIAAWFVSRGYAAAISVLSAMTWYLADITSGHMYSHFMIPYWNSFMRMGIFLIVTFFLAKVRYLLEREKSMARSDFLTGVTNSRAFYEVATQEIERSARFRHPFSLAYIDIDNFKQVNDTLGHNAGDTLLYAVASEIKKSVRSLDAVSRLGGDEFAILLPETNEHDAVIAVKKVRKHLLSIVQENNWPVTFSMGVVTCFEFCNLDELIREADDLMYMVKTSGKNRIESKVHSSTTTSAQ